MPAAVKPKSLVDELKIVIRDRIGLAQNMDGYMKTRQVAQSVLHWIQDSGDVPLIQGPLWDEIGLAVLSNYIRTNFLHPGRQALNQGVVDAPDEPVVLAPIAAAKPVKKKKLTFDDLVFWVPSVQAHVDVFKMTRPQLLSASLFYFGQAKANMVRARLLKEMAALCANDDKPVGDYIDLDGIRALQSKIANEV